jgi:hypothetical protein
MQQDSAAALDAYLQSRFGIALERALADATAGLWSFALRNAVTIACDPIGRYEYPDGGVSEQHQGIIDVEGVVYRFRCLVFEDTGGSRYVESIGELELLRWGVRLAMPDRQAQRG